MSDLDHDRDLLELVRFMERIWKRAAAGEFSTPVAVAFAEYLTFAGSAVYLLARRTLDDEGAEFLRARFSKIVRGMTLLAESRSPETLIEHDPRFRQAHATIALFDRLNELERQAAARGVRQGGDRGR